MQNSDWYLTLIKPVITPPAAVFPVAWSFLYFTIFLSLIFFIKGGNISQKIFPLTFFVVQMILNFSWSPVFFGMQKMGVALFIVILMWIFISLTVITFWQHSKLAAVLLVPYFLWTTFAVYLNFEFVRLN